MIWVSQGEVVRAFEAAEKRDEDNIREILKYKIEDTTDSIYLGCLLEHGRIIEKGTCFGLDYLITTMGSHPCAYVRIPKGHPLYSKHYTDINKLLEVHGGFTFSGSLDDLCLSIENGKLLGWLGWDYAHAGDFIDLSDIVIKKKLMELDPESTLPNTDGRKYTPLDIAVEIFNVCKQLSSY